MNKKILFQIFKYWPIKGNSNDASKGEFGHEDLRNKTF